MPKTFLALLVAFSCVSAHFSSLGRWRHESAQDFGGARCAHADRERLRAGRLVAMFDGIENAGWGVHDETTRTWKDLVGTNDITLGINVDWADTHDGIYCSYNNGGAFRPGKISPYTLEMVIKKTTSSVYGSCFQDTTDDVYFSNQSTQAFGWKNSSIGQNFNGYFHAPVGIAFSFNYKKEPNLTEKVFALNSSYVQKSADGEQWVIPGKAICVGGRSDGSATYSNPNNMVGYTYACRLYSRNLNDAEIAANYEIDKARFNIQDA